MQFFFWKKLKGNLVNFQESRFVSVSLSSHVCSSIGIAMLVNPEVAGSKFCDTLILEGSN